MDFEVKYVLFWFLGAENLETELYKEYSSNPTKLRSQFMSKLSNLKDPKNPSLRTGFIQGELSAAQIAKMTPAEMASDELKASVAHSCKNGPKSRFCSSVF